MTWSDVISPYFPVFIAAFLVTLVATPVMRWIAMRAGVVDQPDLLRKRHREPVAYLGGVAIFLGWIVGIAVSRRITPHNAEMLPPQYHAVIFPWSIVFGAIVIMLTGLIDDIFKISPRKKFGGQLIAAGLLAYNDVGTKLMTDLFSIAGYVDQPWVGSVSYALGALVIAFFVVGGCNAVNLLDGLDGLAAGVCAIACIGFLIITGYIAVFGADLASQRTPQDLLAEPVRAVLCLAILGALIGFLPYNFNPANIFMGDSGSLLLGFLCVTTLLHFAHAVAKGPLLVTAALIVFAVPITETTVTIFRRVMARKPLFQGDNLHMHHQLMRMYRNMGLGENGSVRAAVLTMYLLAIIFCVLGCLMATQRWRYPLAVFVVIFGFTLVTAYKVGKKQAKILLEQDAKASAAAMSATTNAPSAPPADPAASDRTATAPGSKARE